jgi:hypothetical protein
MAETAAVARFYTFITIKVYVSFIAACLTNMSNGFLILICFNISWTHTHVGPEGGNILLLLFYDYGSYDVKFIDFSFNKSSGY